MLLYSIIVTILFSFSFLTICVLLYRMGFVSKLLIKLGKRQPKPKLNWAVFSWNNMLEKLGYKADIVFFGDSIVRGSDFQKSFPDKRIVNLGYSGDTLAGMLGRVSMIKALNPEKIFILAGVNGLTNKNYHNCILTYAALLDSIRNALPDAEIYVHSVLPLSEKKQRQICKNETIVAFNKLLANLVQQKGAKFINIYELYLKDGVLNPELTVDGIHLHPFAYESWAGVLKKYI